MTQFYPHLLWSLPSSQCENDCACVVNYSRQAEPNDTRTTWRCSPTVHLSPLSNDHVVAFNTAQPGAITVLDQLAQRILAAHSYSYYAGDTAGLLPDITPELFAGISFLMASLGLLEQFEGAVPPAVSQPTLSAWLHITNSCNLNCSYCYVSKSTEDMTESTGRAAVDAIFRSAKKHGYRSVKLKYAGGEPTCNFKLVRALHGYANKVADQTGLQLEEVLLSNGVKLTPSMLEFVKKANMRLMISLDGIGVEHDNQRPFPNGAPSSGHVRQGVDRAILHGVKPYVSITVSPASAGSLAETIEFLLERDLLFNLNLVRAHYSADEHWETALISGLRVALDTIETHLPRHRIVDGLVDNCSFTGARNVPCAAGRDYVAITHRGEIARCHMMLTEKTGDVWEADPLTRIQLPSPNIPHLTTNVRAKCRDCVWRSVCSGGCPLLTLQTYGHTDLASPYCNVYTAILPKLLRLEGLRLLRWGQYN